MQITRLHTRKANKLFCAGSGTETLFILAPTIYDALLVSAEARFSNDADLALFAEYQRIAAEPTRAVAKRLGVSRQTVSNWRLRARVKYETGRVTDKLFKGESLTISQINQLAEEFSLKRVTVERYCREIGVNIVRPSRVLSDYDLVDMARGKTWQEFSEAAGKTLPTLRSYIYARPDLARAVRAVMVLGTPRKMTC